MSASDLELLRRYEPVVCFTAGEQFFPCPVEHYIAQCSLWQRSPDRKNTLIVEAGQLNADWIAAFAELPPGHTVYMHYVNQPLDPLEYAQWRHEIPPFPSAGRLARVGLGSRIIDSFFDLSLLIRGRVPGGTAAAAHRQYQQMCQQDPRHTYYGRVVREGAYIILHYMFFYVMNNWRSTFYGVNDHEGDWEQIFVYLSDEGEAEPIPRWVAYATHEESGDNLRRRWDDPALTIVEGTHPVIFAGAGSHASYFEAGEYLSQFRLQLLEPIRNVLQVGRRFWVETLQQGQSATDITVQQVDDLFAIPFIDYALGDGMRIGPGQAATWTPVLVDEQTGWLQHYRGLWGLDTRDPFGGERAPAGPKFNRDGTIRQSWHNPLGWSGLHKVAPPAIAIIQLRQRIPHMQAELQALREEISQKRDSLRLLDLEVRALLTAEYLDKLYEERSDLLHEQESTLNQLYEKAAGLEDTLRASRNFLADLERGDAGDPRAHLTHLRTPLPPQPPYNRFVEFWAALSSGLLFLMLALSFVITPGRWILRVFVIIAAFFLIEAILRQQLARLLLNITMILAIITAGVLIAEFLPLVLVGVLLALARLLLLENWRELRGR